MIHLTEEKLTALRSSLEPGEQLRWSAEEHTSRLVRKNLGEMLFSIIVLAWIGVLFFSSFGADNPTSQILMLVLLALILFSFLRISGIFLFRLVSGRRTIYAVTDRRALLFEPGSRPVLTSFEPQKFGALFKMRRGDGSGDLVLARRINRRSRGGVRLEDIGFYDVPAIDDVEELVLNLALPKRGPEF